MISLTTPLATARTELANAIADQKTLQAALGHARAFAEQRAIENAGEGGEKAMGANEAARARSMTIYLAGDRDYQLTLTALRAGEARVATAQTALDLLLDQRREQEWLIKERMTIALEMRLADEPDDAHHPEEAVFSRAIEDDAWSRDAGTVLDIQDEDAERRDEIESGDVDWPF